MDVQGFEMLYYGQWRAPWMSKCMQTQSVKDRDGHNPYFLQYKTHYTFFKPTLTVLWGIYATTHKMSLLPDRSYWHKHPEKSQLLSESQPIKRIYAYQSFCAFRLRLGYMSLKGGVLLLRRYVVQGIKDLLVNVGS